MIDSKVLEIGNKLILPDVYSRNITNYLSKNSLKNNLRDLFRLKLIKDFE